MSRIASTPYHVAIGFDIETTGKNPRENKLVMVQLKPRGKKPLLIDARDEDRGALRDALLPLLRDNKRKFLGQNLLFELHWMLSYLGVEVNDLRARFDDTMLRELVILGLGLGDAAKRGFAVSMYALGQRYEIPVHKEEQSWFINLDKPRWFYADGSYSFEKDDKRVWFHADHSPYEEDEEVPTEVVRESDEQWHQPFSQKILEYGRQDVSVVHLIEDKQQALIDEYGLQKVIDLEARSLPATAGMQHYGLMIDREKWLGIIQGISDHADELSAKLHEEIDVPVLEDRRRRWEEESKPYQAWARGKEEAVAVAKNEWEGLPKWEDRKKEVIVEFTTIHPRPKKPLDLEWREMRDKLVEKAEQEWNVPTWGEYKKRALAEYEAANPKPKAPGPIKDGVNLSSSDQMQVAFRSRGHQLESVKEEVLTPLAAQDPVIQLYLEFKEFSTARTKYGLKYLDEHAFTGIIYSTIQQIGAETGRFSFKEPNVQQVPSKGAGAPLRTAIVPRPGYVFIDADFTNVELMIVSWITKDPVMMKAFTDGEDLHARTAEVMFGLRNKLEYLEALEAGVTPKKWTDSHDAVVGGRTLLGTSYRAVAKKINFMLFYGGGASLLASELRISVADAKELMRLYRETYKVAVRWLRKQGDRIEKPYKDGRVFASTLAGRRRWFTLPVLSVDKNTTAEEAQKALEDYNKRVAGIQRQLGNHPVQGTSADITKLAIALWQERYNSPEMRLVATVHDELLLEVVDDPHTIEVANQRLGVCMHQALVHFLVDMPAKVPVGKVAKYWEH